MPEVPPDQELEAARENLQLIEQRFGAQSFELAAELDKLAALLRKKKQTLEAVNLEARAKSIRASLGIIEPSKDVESEDLGSTPAWSPGSKKSSRAWLYAVLAALLGLSAWCMWRLDFTMIIVGVFLTALSTMIVFLTIESPIMIRLLMIIAWIVLICVPPLLRCGSNLDLISKYQFARALYYNGEIKEAYDKFEVLAPKNPGSMELWRAIALCSLDLQKYDESISASKRVLKLQADEPLAYYCRGSAYLAQNQYQEASDDLKRVVEIVAKISTKNDKIKRVIPMARVHFRLAQALKQLGHTDEANDFFAQAKDEGIIEDEDGKVVDHASRSRPLF